MAKAKKGNTVRIHYTAKTEDSSVFYTSKNAHPLKFEIGSSDVISGLEKGVIGMEIGETKTINISPNEGFGRRREALVDTIKRNDFPNHLTPVVGQKIEVVQPNGQCLDVYVTHIKGEEVTIDANHPLAGLTLKFEVEMMDIA